MRFRIDPSNPKTAAKLVKAGRGLRDGGCYAPWITVRDFSSCGEANRLNGWRTGPRLLHLFSKLERAFFYRLEWFEDVTDYREQFPLDVKLTSTIAEELDLRHPISQKTGLPMPMTTDFLVTCGVAEDRKLLAYYVKPSEQLELQNSKHPRQVKNNWVKLKIEQEYWRRCGVQHAVVTERDFDWTISQNVRAVHTFYAAKSVVPLDASEVETIHAELLPKVALGRESLANLAYACDVRLGYPVGTSLKVAKHLIANRRWPVNFRVKFDPCYPLALNL